MSRARHSKDLSSEESVVRGTERLMCVSLKESDVFNDNSIFSDSPSDLSFFISNTFRDRPHGIIVVPLIVSENRFSFLFQELVDSDDSVGTKRGESGFASSPLRVQSVDEIHADKRSPYPSPPLRLPIVIFPSSTQRMFRRVDGNEAILGELLWKITPSRLTFPAVMWMAPGEREEKVIRLSVVTQLSSRMIPLSHEQTFSLSEFEERADSGSPTKEPSFRMTVDLEADRKTNEGSVDSILIVTSTIENVASDTTTIPALLSIDAERGTVIAGSPLPPFEMSSDMPVETTIGCVCRDEFTITNVDVFAFRADTIDHARSIVAQGSSLSPQNPSSSPSFSFTWRIRGTRDFGVVNETVPSVRIISRAFPTRVID
ncbi:hypothetical protein BLNAU_12130 [Blattamonas nauphoetae]|uniref:Uncharacterized protein n=1 Tax=Blattamonas nauphoetae TaxID=2049346 RepID=A0ABQ9XMH1_9EUKA|nr:hypothetical protein BLNAU_12130 [Blattamonas nauphoetae]